MDIEREIIAGELSILADDIFNLSNEASKEKKYEILSQLKEIVRQYEEWI